MFNDKKLSDGAFLFTQSSSKVSGTVDKTMSNPTLTATYTYCPASELQFPSKQVTLAAPVAASDNITSSQELDSNTNDKSQESNSNTAPSVKAHLPSQSYPQPTDKGRTTQDTLAKYAYLAALRAAAGKVQDDVNVLLTREMEADKVRDANLAEGKDNMSSSIRRGSRKGKDEELDDDEDDIGDEGEEDT